MDRRTLIKSALGSFVAVTSVDVIPSSSKNDYVTLLDILVKDARDGKKIDMVALKEILLKIEPGVACYYLKQFFSCGMNGVNALIELCEWAETQPKFFKNMVNWKNS